MPRDTHTRALSRRRFLGGATGLAALTGGSQVASSRVAAQSAQTTAAGASEDAMALVNGRIHTMDPDRRVVSQALIRGGRFAAVGDDVLQAQGTASQVVDLQGRTVIPGIIDAHNHIVLVGNRPGWHTPLEHVFTIPDAVAALQARSADVPPGEFITTIGPVAAMQFPERRLPTLAELDAVPRPVYIQAAQGGTRTNSAGRAWFQARGVEVADDGTIGGRAASQALLALRRELLTPEARRRTTLGALQYYASLGVTTHRDSGAFHAEEPAGGIASENLYTMHEPLLALDGEKRLPVRVRLDFLHQDSPDADPPLPTLSARLRNSFPFFGNDWLRTGGIGEFTGGGIEGLRAIARAGWRGEDHALNLAGVTRLIELREQVHAETPITDLRWILSHIPAFPRELADRAHAMGMGVLVGWGPTRTGTDVGPPYRMLVDHPIPVGFHSDGGDITVISPWLNFYTIATGRNLVGESILGTQTLTREETIWLATAANAWFIREDDLGSIAVGQHADLAVLDRDYFAVPESELLGTRSLLTIVGGRVVHDDGVV
jgi:predicted amidohydrolase YtcJ